MALKLLPVTLLIRCPDAFPVNVRKALALGPQHSWLAERAHSIGVDGNMSTRHPPLRRPNLPLARVEPLTHTVRLTGEFDEVLKCRNTVL